MFFNQTTANAHYSDWKNTEIIKNFTEKFKKFLYRNQRVNNAKIFVFTNCITSSDVFNNRTLFYNCNCC